MYRLSAWWLLAFLTLAVGYKLFPDHSPITPLGDQGSCVDPDGRPLPCQPR